MSINVGGGELRELKPRILVIGVGGAGGNAFEFPVGKVAGFFGGLGGHLHNLNVFYEKA